MLTTLQKNQLRELPPIHELIAHPMLDSILYRETIDQETLTRLCQETVQHVREQIVQNTLSEKQSIMMLIKEHIEQGVQALVSSPLKPLINGTGVVLHTNLGRAKLSQAAQQAMAEVARYYSSLEYKIDEGIRGSRHDIVEKLICHLTGAEAALVCNNNAAAVFLVLKELAQGQEVIVSRGELVEIGGSFRVFEIMKECGAQLVEVGTTNKTHLYDYERAITENTGLILKVHTSNFVIKGFTASVAGTELVSLAHQHNVPVFEDLGSGVLLDLRPFGIGNEPTVQEVLQDGVDLVSFSGDKLLGGPQAGIIAGKAKYIKRLKKNQLMRSLRVDKFTLAALHATLQSYLHPEKAMQDIPTLQLILQTQEDIKSRAQAFIERYRSEKFDVSLIEIESEVGGGTMPEVKLPSYGVYIKPIFNVSVAQLSKRMRQAEFPVIGRINEEKYILDFRTITDEEVPLLIQALDTVGEYSS